MVKKRNTWQNISNKIVETFSHGGQNLRKNAFAQGPFPRLTRVWFTFLPEKSEFGGGARDALSSSGW